MSNLNSQFYFLSPVEVVRVSPKNLQEVAEWCGGSVHETESRRVPGRMDSYVWVPTPKGAAISWAFPGMFITKRVVVTEKDELKVTFSVFRKDYFNKNYFKEVADAAEKTWERQAREAAKVSHPAAGVVAVAFQKPELAQGPLNDVVTPELLPLVDQAIVASKGSSMVEQREALAEAAVDPAPVIGVQYKDPQKADAQMADAMARMAAGDPHRA